MSKMMLRLEQNQNDYWEFTLYFEFGRRVLKNHGEFRNYDDAVLYAHTYLHELDVKFSFDKEHKCLINTHITQN